MMVERLMATVTTLMDRSTPNGTRRPVGIGTATTFQKAKPV
jgi:hypothetical protein